MNQTEQQKQALFDSRRGFAVRAETAIMGILNVTPDSFSDGGRNYTVNAAVTSAAHMQHCGADCIDIGAQSTRPGFQAVSAAEEWARLEPVLKALRGVVSVPISVDTFYVQVAERALDMGAAIINDVSGHVDEAMAQAICRYNAGWIIMHNGRESELADAVGEVNSWFKLAVRTAVYAGVPPSHICLDAGIGFGKTTGQCHELIANGARVRLPDFAYLVGLSRKRCVGEPAGDIPAAERDAVTVAADTIAIMSGADILRVHDVKNAVDAARTAEAILESVHTTVQHPSFGKIHTILR